MSDFDNDMSKLDMAIVQFGRKVVQIGRKVIKTTLFLNSTPTRFRVSVFPVFWMEGFLECWLGCGISKMLPGHGVF